MMGWQWHQLNHMQAICTSFQKITTPAPHHSYFYGPDALPDTQPDALPDTQPTASKHWRPMQQSSGLNSHSRDAYSLRPLQVTGCKISEQGCTPLLNYIHQPHIKSIFHMKVKWYQLRRSATVINENSRLSCTIRVLLINWSYLCDYVKCSCSVFATVSL